MSDISGVKKYSIADIEKALEYMKKQHMDSVTVAVDDMKRLQIGGYNSFNRSGITVTVFTSDVTKKPEVTKTDTLE